MMQDMATPFPSNGRRSLLRMTLWGWAFLLSAVLVLISLFFVYQLSYSQPQKTDISTSVSEDVLFVAAGEHLSADLDRALSLIYTDESDEVVIAKALLHSLFRDVFGDSADLSAILSTLPPSSYSVILQKKEDAPLEWLFNLTISQEESETEDLLRTLREGFSSRFTNTKVRTRELPSGREVQDVIEDEVGITDISSIERRFFIRTLRHEESGESFYAAKRGGRLLLSNSEELINWEFCSQRGPLVTLL